MFEHERGAQDEGAGIYFVLTGIFGRGAMRSLENGCAIADVRARRHAEPAHLRRAGVGEVVAVEIGRRKHRVLIGPQEELLEHRVGNHVLDHDLAGHGVPAGYGLVGELFSRELVTPILKAALGELLNVTLVNDGYGGQIAGNGIPDRPAN